MTPVNILISVINPISTMIISFSKTPSNLLNWISVDKLDWSFLSQNPNAIDLIEANLDKIDWATLSINSAAIHLLKANQDKIDWCWLSKNPAAIGLLKENYDKIQWPWLSMNTSAASILKNNLDKVDWAWMSQNAEMVDVLEANMGKVNWNWLSINPKAIHLLEANQDKINWYWLSSNPAAIHLLEANPDKINWGILSRNPNAIHLLEANQDKIDWSRLSANPAIFSYTTTKNQWSRTQLNIDEDTHDTPNELLTQINSPIVKPKLGFFQRISSFYSWCKCSFWGFVIESKYATLAINLLKKIGNAMLIVVSGTAAIGLIVILSIIDMMITIYKIKLYLFIAMCNNVIASILMILMVICIMVGLLL